jgi:hypothetical protein
MCRPHNNRQFERQNVSNTLIDQAYSNRDKYWYVKQSVDK